MFTAWSNASITGRKSNFIHKSFVTLSRLGLESDENIPNVLDYTRADGLVKEWRGENLEDECAPQVESERIASRVSSLGEKNSAWRIKSRASLSSFWLITLSTVRYATL